MQTPDKLKNPVSKTVSPETKQAVKDIFRDLELRRQALSMKIPLANLEKVFKFILK